jgi:hypothetical protein
MEVKSFLSFVNQICFINFILVIWFHTEAFLEYIKLFRLNFLFRVNKFYEYKKINPTILYTDFLSIKNPNFLSKLFSCPYCLNFWITLISCILYNNILYLPTIYLTSMIIYKILRSKFNE